MVLGIGTVEGPGLVARPAEMPNAAAKRHAGARQPNGTWFWWFLFVTASVFAAGALRLCWECVNRGGAWWWILPGAAFMAWRSLLGVLRLAAGARP